MTSPSESQELICGAHSVLECVKSRIRPIERLYIARGTASRPLEEVIQLARQAGLPIKFEPREVLDRKTGKGVHRGVVALAGDSGRN